jgi:hypothetical protein
MKKVMSVRSIQYGDEELIARSEAKRLLEGADGFKTVVLDFAGVEELGRAFADEIFRVFANKHPQIEIIPQNASDKVMRMIRRARSST